jgi:hypothetical protein
MKRVIKLGAALCLSLALREANAASCSTQSQLPIPQRDALANQARSLAALVQSGDTASLRARTLPAIASDFDAIASSVTSLKSLVQNATITVDDIYSLDASKDQPGAPRTQFFCGSPIVVLTFNGIPPGDYALVILHATGVPKPQQISFILAASPTNQWQLAGFYAKPMIEADHDGLWYWKSARRYAHNHGNLTAWLYYRIAEDLLSPLDFLSSPNLQKLQQEADQARPPVLSANSTMMLNANGITFNVTNVGTTTQFGGLDLDLHYTPDPAQTGELRTPVEARQQVTNLMTALLTQHPELRQAFHGIWAHADQGQSSLFALELPMNQIATTQAPPPSAAR